MISWVLTAAMTASLFVSLPITACADGSVVPISGQIQENTTWTADNQYVIEGDTPILSGAALTINPGVIVKIKSGVRFLVSGTLHASGTEGNEIYFTDFRDDTVGGDTNGDGGASSPAAGGWTYMQLGYNNDAAADLSHCVIRYGGGSWGGFGNDSLITVNAGSNVSIDHCELAHSALRGIRIEGATGTVGISNSAIYDNAQYGLYINNSRGNVGITGCQIYNSASGQIRINNSPNVTITATSVETLNASAAPGTVAGSTKMEASVGSGNHLVVQICSSSISDVDLHSIVPTGAGIIDPYTQGANIVGADPIGEHAQFGVVSGGSGNAVTAAALGTDTQTIELTLTTAVIYGQIVEASYTPGTVSAADGGMLAAFANQSVTNNAVVNVAQIGSTRYPTFAGALAAATGAIIADAKNVTIDLNGFDLTVSGVAGHALEAKSNGTLNVLGDGILTVHSAGEDKHCVNAVSGGKVNIKGNLTASLPAGAGSHQDIIGAYADGAGSTITLTGSVFGHMAGVYAQNGAVITVSGNVSGAYYGAFSAYNGSVNITGTVSGSRALVSEYGGIAAV